MHDDTTSATYTICQGDAEEELRALVAALKRRDPSGLEVLRRDVEAWLAARRDAPERAPRRNLD